MPHDIPWAVHAQNHPGSSAKDIANEPDWTSAHSHRIGFRNHQDRIPGITHRNDDYDEEVLEARREFQELKDEVKRGDLINFRDVMKHEKDFHIEQPQNRSIGWRYVLEADEDWIKKKEQWPANIKRRQKQEATKKEEEQSEERNRGPVQKSNENEGTPQKEHEWKRQQGDNNKHNDAYAGSVHSNDRKGATQEGYRREQEKLHEMYSPQEIALLRSLRHENEYVKKLKANDGKRKSPQHHNRTQVSIDEADQFTPDNWLPRSSDLIRLTGKHPLNAEAHLSHLFDAGLITPNEFHYVRNHGAVPRLLWELHTLEIGYGTLNLSMDDLKNNYESINIAVALACDGNRRKELNMVKKSKGFSWGAGAVSCAYWKGPLLRDVLLSAGIPERLPHAEGKRYWVNFEGADDPSEGKYATCLPFQYAMDPTNDVILAYEMNDVPLPPDHGYPVRLMIPGYVGGRCVKWLKKIWISEKENDSHYHIWDNRVLPSFVTEKDGEFAEALFRHPDTACNEQNLNSVIVHPAQGERIPLTEARKGHSYRISGYAYDGGGHEVQRVEVSLDAGETWLYCIRKFPDYPIRHGNKYWAWIHWHLDVELTHLLRAKSITVRCFNVFKNTQPERPNWNVMGMMNNCWYVVRPEVVDPESKDDVPHILFRHPCEPGTGDGGWMKPSVENQIASAKQDAGAPQKQFTREEIEKHDTEDDCWIVVDGKVYDATSVLSWHPGGKSAITGHAGKVHHETSDEFASIHDGYAYQKLKECILGVVTDKAMNFIKVNAKKAAQEKANSQSSQDQLTLQKHRWVPVKLIDRKNISKDTRTYTFSLPDDRAVLGLGTCQHVQIGFHLKDRMLIRSYTPTRPLLPAPADAPKKLNDSKASGKRSKHDDIRDGDGTFDLTVKTYFPDDNQPGGALSNILDCMPMGEEVEIRGPTGEIVYNGNGRFVIDDHELVFKRVSLVLGGSGITPGYALIARILLSQGDDTEVRVVDANKSEADILLREDLDKFVKNGKGQLEVAHVLSHPSDEWKGLKGHVNADIIKANLFQPGKGSAVFLCGPPAMIQKAAVPALRADWGYKDEESMFGF
ncbi:hypothetical protein K490DRAFT_37273 [Saccharata proteae CBS 121410]|uniref:Nitrate reductase [NADPH] n=1 Tax=Saccharata proteae CBS 121410 TaxID=1314787 RepID=A0A6A5YCI8_9PEZI|nr:hypothetical protein K490DRAFT_37273 [Saccharata proteae CBS 121410]